VKLLAPLFFRYPTFPSVHGQGTTSSSCSTNNVFSESATAANGSNGVHRPTLVPVLADLEGLEESAVDGGPLVVQAEVLPRRKDDSGDVAEAYLALEKAQKELNRLR